MYLVWLFALLSFLSLSVVFSVFARKKIKNCSFSNKKKKLSQSFGFFYSNFETNDITKDCEMIVGKKKRETTR